MSTDDSLVEVVSNSGPEFLLLTPGVYPPRTGQFFGRFLQSQDIYDVSESIRKSRVVAIDFETDGGDYSRDIRVVGVGLAWDSGSCYVDVEFVGFLEMVFKHPGLIAHNVNFDGGVLYKNWGKHANWHCCTYALLAMLHNESPESRWGLKSAMTSLLGWEDSNEHELDEWLVVNGYYIGNKLVDESPENLRSRYRSGATRPDKSKMHLAPASILGKYCILDAEATYLLYTHLLSPQLERFPGLATFFFDSFMPLILLLIEQKIGGINMNVEGLQSRLEDLEKNIRELSMRFADNEQVYPWILKIEQDLRQPLFEKEPTKLKKNGEISKNWVKWEERIRKAMEGEDSDYLFNIDSGPQMRTLLYDMLGFPIRSTTETGLPGLGITSYKHMGELGQILVDRMYAVKELGFIEKYLELTADRTTIHPSFRSPGTVTGRLSSKEPNMQQIPKTRAMMDLFRAPPGKIWVDLDFSALEPVVATEFSQDENMLRIYGDNAPSNDIYLFVAASVPGIAEKIRATRYDPYNPTRESLKRAKTECKRERNICKTVVLACQYGAGVKKIVSTLEEDGITLTYEEVEVIHSGYWNLFSGVRDFARSLHYEWKRNGGYILNGMGRPMAVPESYNKDLLNRFIQSTGHDILVRYIRILSDTLNAARINWRPLIIDFHDSAAIELGELDREQAVQCYLTALDQLNSELNGTIRLKGTPSWGITLTDIKEPEQ